MMRTVIVLAAGLLLVAAAQPGPDPQAAAKARQQAGTALVALPAPKSEGERLFQSHCAACHADGKMYPGTFYLRQNGQSQPVLAKRTDLTPEYVKLVVRNGLGVMPALTPTHVSDADLDKIAAYLGAKK